MLGDKYLETLAITRDTSFIINKSNYPDPFIAVAPFCWRQFQQRKQLYF